MIKNFTLKKGGKNAIALFFLVSTTFSLTANAQTLITKISPSAANESYGGSGDAIADITTPSNSYDGNENSKTTISTKRTGAIVGQKHAEISYTFPTSSNSIYVKINTYTNNDLEIQDNPTFLGTQGGTTIYLYNDATALNKANTSYEYIRDISGNQWVIIHAKDNYNKVTVKTTSKNYGLENSDNSKTTDIYEIFQKNKDGVVSNMDCGTPIFTKMDTRLDGLPLAGPVNNESNMVKTIDGDIKTYQSFTLAGLANIGAPAWINTYYFDGLSNTNSTFKFRLGNGAQLLSLGSVEYKVTFYNNDVEISNSGYKTFNVIGLLFINNYASKELFETCNQPFNKVLLECRVPGVSATGEYLRVYEIARTVNAPISTSSIINIPHNTPAQITVNSGAANYNWYKSIKQTVENIEYIIPDTANTTGFLGNTTGTLIDNSFSTTFTTPFNVTEETDIFVTSTNGACGFSTSEFTRITLKPQTVLPVSFTNFNLKNANGNVLLSWATATELNNKGFNVLRSSNGINWNTIGFVNSKNTNSNNTLNYSFTDKTPLNGTTYYRLEQVDINGKTSLSETKTISLDFTNIVNVYPNPAKENVNIKTAINAKISIMDITGKTIINTTATNNLTEINVNQLSAGNYIVLVNENGNITSKKLTITK